MQNAKILIVEDMPQWADEIQTLLTKAGYNVIKDVAATVKSAITIIQKEMPDLVILDIDLLDSETGGIEVARYIRENRLMIRTIFWTRWNDQNIQKQAAQVRFQYFLSKNDIDETILLVVRNSLKFPLEELYQNKILKANGQLMYSGNNSIWIKGNIYEISGLSYIMSNGHKTYFHFKNGKKVIVTLHLGKILKALNHPHLLKVHRSFVVNISAILRIPGDDVYVIDPVNKDKGRRIPIAKSNLHKLHEAWLQFGNSEK
jgi:DNA-binding LytR/AlgR family response regulator